MPCTSSSIDVLTQTWKRELEHQSHGSAPHIALAGVHSCPHDPSYSSLKTYRQMSTWAATQRSRKVQAGDPVLLIRSCCACCAWCSCSPEVAPDDAAQSQAAPVAWGHYLHLHRCGGIPAVQGRREAHARAAAGYLIPLARSAPAANLSVVLPKRIPLSPPYCKSLSLPQCKAQHSSAALCSRYTCQCVSAAPCQTGG